MSDATPRRGLAIAAWTIASIGIALRLLLFRASLPAHGAEARSAGLLLRNGEGSLPVAGDASGLFEEAAAALCHAGGAGDMQTLRLLPLTGGCLAVVLATVLALRILPGGWPLAMVAAVALGVETLMASVTWSPEAPALALGLATLLVVTPPDDERVTWGVARSAVLITCGALAGAMFPAVLPLLLGCLVALAWRAHRTGHGREGLAVASAALGTALAALLWSEGAAPRWSMEILSPEGVAARIAGWFGATFRGPALLVLAGGIFVSATRRPVLAAAAMACVLGLPGSGAPGADGAALAVALPVALLGVALVDARRRLLTVLVRTLAAAALVAPGIVTLVDVLPDGAGRRVEPAALAPTLVEEARPGDRVVVLPAASDAWRFYRAPLRIVDRAVFVIPSDVAETPAVLPGLVVGREEKRVWIVAARVSKLSVDGSVLDGYARRGRSTVRDSEPGAVLYLWEAAE